MRVAAEVFSIRYVCGFGNDLPDGVVSFDDLFNAQTSDPVRSLALEQRSNPAAHVAVITFDVGEGGVVPVARNHIELLTGGLGVLLESRLAQDDTILSTLVPSSFAGLCQTLLPWLLCGGTLLLHHPFDLPALAEQWRTVDGCGALMVPAPIAFRLAETDEFSETSLANIVASWRSPEQLSKSQPWSRSDIGFVDVSIFGEIGLVAARRDPSGQPVPLPLGPVIAPRDGSGGVPVVELSTTQQRTLGFRGPMVPHHNFPPGAERAGLPHLAIGPDGMIDTGYACEPDESTKTLVVTAPPSGIVNVGGYRLPLRDLQDVVGRIDAAASLAAMPDPLVGQRLVGLASDRHTMQAALGAVGVNPIVVSAFRHGDDPALAVTPGGSR
jgi:hypothetical protein